MLAAAAVFTLALAAGQRAEAMSLITPGTSPAKAVGDGLIQVRGGHGGGGHGGGGHGGGHGGGFHGGGFHGGGMHALPWWRRRHALWRRSTITAAIASRISIIIAVSSMVATTRYYYSYYPHCRIIYTYYGPRRVCGYRHWHRWHHYHRWHHHRRY